MSQNPEITNRTYTPEVIDLNIVEHKLGRLKKDCVTVKLNSEEYAFCAESAQDLWANTKKTAYGKGILNSEQDKTRTERTGILGEMAFAKIAGLVVDATYSEGGALHDFEGEYGSIDVKTASKLQTYKSMLVYAKSGSGKEIPLNSTYYVGAFIAHEDREEQKATVIIVGWCTKETLAARPLVPGKQGFWYNREMPYDHLKNIGELLKIIKGDQNDNEYQAKKKLQGAKR
jgi:hypothetical protein